MIQKVPSRLPNTQDQSQELAALRPQRRHRAQLVVLVIFQEGLNRGVVTAADMQNYLAIAGTPVLGWICKLVPGFRERVMGNPR